MSPYHHGDLPTALLNSAEAILERDGISALTMRAAAREAGVSHAAPAHHFGDLSGLLSELAASGFVRLREFVEAQAANAAPIPGERLKAFGQGYVGFAQAHPGLFQLMFRSERLDWSKPSLSSAGASAFALLTLTEGGVANSSFQSGFRGVVAATARWSFIHGLAMLLIDGRLEAIAGKVPGTSTDALIEELLKCLVRQERTGDKVSPV